MNPPLINAFLLHIAKALSGHYPPQIDQFTCNSNIEAPSFHVNNHGSIPWVLAHEYLRQKKKALRGANLRAKNNHFMQKKI